MRKVIITISILLFGFVSLPQKSEFDIENSDRILVCTANIWHSYSVQGFKISLPKDEYFVPGPEKPVELYFPFSISTYFRIVGNNIVPIF